MSKYGMQKCPSTILKCLSILLFARISKKNIFPSQKPSEGKNSNFLLCHFEFFPIHPQKSENKSELWEGKKYKF